MEVESELKVVTWNVNGLAREKCRKLNRIKSYDADVVGIT